ncbi:hypothetical protein EMPS_05769 [Entomortierella parvispora]|uniref:GH16 domain-containing protein n=1 Tax=Entomortierella parvispora TaxID=205924 RepID=A0A9P3HB87_9FUNG|nr:hypothetical protein EMPS_05769 [Entomortierella parvispora]
MRISLLLLLPFLDIWIEAVRARDSVACGPSVSSSCPESTPCCNNGICHQTSLTACPISLGCDPWHSYSLEDVPVSKQHKEKDSSQKSNSPPNSACFALPVCRSFKDNFKSNKPDRRGQHQVLIPKFDFSGDPDQAHWTSDFEHLASEHVLVDTKKKKLLLKAKRDKIKTQSGGGFGATISSTRWNKYGSFSAKFKSGASGPGIVTAMMLSNPNLGEEITIEVTGRDPKTVITDFFRDSVHSQTRGWSAYFHAISFKGLRSCGRTLKNLFLPLKGKTKSRAVVPVDYSHKEVSKKGSRGILKDLREATELDKDDGSLEASHALKKSAVDKALVYKIEWTEEKIVWFVDGKVLRTLTSAELLRERGYGLPTEPMQMQLTIWDAGYSKETRAWAGGETDYGANNEKEYVTSVDWIEIVCQDAKESSRNPWPGLEAEKRLEQVKKETEAIAKEEEKKAQEEKKKLEDAKKAEELRGKGGKERGLAVRFVGALVNLLIKWAFILVIITGSAAYLTQPLKDMPPSKLPTKEELYGLQQ